MLVPIVCSFTQTVNWYFVQETSRLPRKSKTDELREAYNVSQAGGSFQ